MLKNYFKIAVRNFRLQRGYTIINIFGLAVSLACATVIFHWVMDEVKVNRFHSNGDQIQQIFRTFPDETGTIQVRQALPFPTAEALVTEVPAIINATGFREMEDCLFTKGETTFFKDGAMSHFSIFDIFSFPLIEGTTTGTEDQLSGVFISQKLATKYFGENWQGNIIGEEMQIKGGDIGDGIFQVLGVFQDIPKNSSLRFEFVTNLKRFANEHPRWARWGSSAFSVYAQMAPDTDPKKLEDKITNFVADHGGQKNLSLMLQPFSDTYLYSNFKDGKIAGGRIEYVRIFLIAAFLLVLMACINFVNLTTARATRRAKEIGVRKVIGAQKKALISQFMIEAGMITFVAIALSIGIAEILFPYANDVLNKSLSFDYSSGLFWMTILSIGVLVTFIAGLYPAFVLSALPINNILKNKIGNQTGSTYIRKGLVIIQFVLSALLLVSTMIIVQQVGFIKNKSLGLDRKEIIQMRIPQPMRGKTDIFKSELLKQPGITQVSLVKEAPIDVQRATDDLSWPGKDPEAETRINYIDTDQDFGSLFKIEMVDGHFHQKQTEDFDTSAIVINETAAQLMGLNDPVGTIVQLSDQKMTVIGVVKDFHLNSLHDQIGPLMIFNSPGSTREISIRYETGKTKLAIANLEATYKKLIPNYPLQFEFLDQQYEALYQSELLIGKLARFFALIAVFISCLGLLGLAAFVAEQKTKEIGIRKVLGASVTSIIRLLSIDFLKVTGIGFLIALPIAWYVTQSWLSNFAFQANIQWWSYLLVGILILGLSLLTVSIQSMRAALLNPVDALKNE